MSAPPQRNVDARGRAAPRVTILAHRPATATFHGSSIMLRGFAERLGRKVPVVVVAPPVRERRGSYDDSSDPLLTGFRYLLLSAWTGLRYMIRDLRRPEAERSNVVLSFDIYLVWLGVFWSWLGGLPFLFYPQDSTGEVSERWTAAGYRGGILFRITRRPLERVAVRTARIVVVPSESMRTAFEAAGVPPERIRVCTLKRPPPSYDANAVAGWRQRLALDGRIPLVFVGSFQYAPNVRAFEYLRDTLAPELLRRDPRILLVVAGLDSEPFIGSGPPNLTVVGTVPDLDGLLYACRVGIAPMDLGGGTSNKIIDYLLHDLDVLATPEAAAGVEATPRVVVARRDEFGERAVRLARELPPSAPPDRGTFPPFLRRYLAFDDIDALGDEIRAGPAAAPATGLPAE